MSETLVKVENVSKKFCRNLKRSLWYGMKDLGNELTARPHINNGQLRKDEFWAVKDVSFDLKRGECLGLIGHNGAGKTTLLRMLNGLIKPDNGRIEIHGKVAALIALGVGFNPILTGRENIYANAAVLGLSKKETDAKLEEIVEFAELNEFIDMPVQSYSSGMTIRLGFATATALEPDVLILDEVLAVGDAAFRVKCFNRMAGLLNKTAVIFVSHNMQQVTRISSCLLLMDHGKVLKQDLNIGSVVSRYHSLQAKPFEPIIQGSGKAIIHSVVLEDQNQKPTTTLRHGSPFSVAIKFSLSQRLSNSLIKILITISDEEDVNVAQILEKLNINNQTKNIYAKIHFTEAIFNAGRYFLTANILEGKVGELISVMRYAALFTIEHDLTGYAPILLQSKHVEINQN
jgi:lipopolysaccharide transport system ATP-binding protein